MLLHLPTVGLKLDLAEPHFGFFDDDEWHTMIPTDGFVDLGPNKRPFLLSVFHEMHCLSVIRKGYLFNGTMAYEHIEHCLRYLRQSILCRSDLTIEPAHMEKSRVTGKMINAGGDLLGQTHRCRDWTVIMKHTFENPSIPHVN